MTRRYFVQRKRKLLTALVILMLAALSVFSGSYWEDTGFEGEVFYLIGLALVGMAVVGRLWCSLYICGYKTHTLITVGPYSLCRHPLYFSNLLGSLGVGLCTETLTIPLIVTGIFLVYYPFVIAAEEKDLCAIHGDAFARYAHATPRLWPSFARLEEPAEYLVKPRIFRNAIVDAMIFLWLAGGLEVIEGMHEHHIIPELFWLY